MKNLLFAILFLTFFSCGNVEKDETKNTKEENLNTLLKSDINLKFTEFELDAKVKEITQNWEKYSELENAMSDLKQANLTYFKKNHEIIEAMLNDLKATIPQKLNSPSVLARILALENAIYKFEGIVNLSNSTHNEVESSLKEVLKSFSNFKFQMNKKIERDSQRIQKPS